MVKTGLRKRSATRSCQRLVSLLSLVAIAFGVATTHLERGLKAANPIPVVEATPATLDVLIDRYFRTTDEKERAAFVNPIENAAMRSVGVVAAAVRQVIVWSRAPEAGLITVETASSGQVKVFWRGFNDPEPMPARPLVLCMPADGEIEEIPDRTLNRAVMTLGPVFCNSCFLVALSRPIGGGFHQHPAAANDLRRIIREVRRHIALDSERLYAFGYGEGGEAVWMASLFQPDHFAGVIAVASHPKLPFPQQIYPLLLPNLKDVAVLVLSPTTSESGMDPALAVKDAHLEAITEVAHRSELPIRRAIVSFDETEFGSLPRWDAVKDDLAAIHEKLRPKPGRPVSHWFRYPAQGDVGWLRAAKTYGEVWTDDQLSIAVKPSTDRDTFITDVLKDKLFYLGGSVDGQTITIETKRVGEVELRLYEGMVDFAKPITVIINGRKRHEAVVRPNITTLLESAYEVWEFQRLVFAKLSFSIRE